MSEQERRQGKTDAVAAIVVLCAMTHPGMTISCFSTGDRTAQKLKAAVIKQFDKAGIGNLITRCPQEITLPNKSVVKFSPASIASMHGSDWGHIQKTEEEKAFIPRDHSYWTP